jgi:tRNA (guanine-N7-)-methyltransferase
MPIRSYVVRNSRITDAQQRAWALYWSRYGIDFSPAPLDLVQLFGRQGPCTLEIGFGNGEHLLARALAAPERDFLGVEVHRPGVGHLLLAAARAEVNNLRLICHDAAEVLGAQIPPDSLDEVLLLFPDPWPKKRHHKRRLVQPPFVQLLASRLRPRGELHLATDWQPYADEMLTALMSCDRLSNCDASGGFSAAPARAATRFEQRGARLGHVVRDLLFRRRNE